MPIPTRPIEIARVCPAAESEFILAQLEKKASIEEAKRAWIAQLESRLEARDQQIADMKERHACEISELETAHIRAFRGAKARIELLKMDLANTKQGHAHNN